MRKPKDAEDWKKFIGAWYRRTLPVVDLDNGGKVIPPPTEKVWKASVEKDLRTLLAKERYEAKKEALIDIICDQEGWNDTKDLVRECVGMKKKLIKGEN